MAGKLLPVTDVQYRASVSIVWLLYMHCHAALHPCLAVRASYMAREIYTQSKLVPTLPSFLTSSKTRLNSTDFCKMYEDLQFSAVLGSVQNWQFVPSMKNS